MSVVIRRIAGSHEHVAELLPESWDLFEQLFAFEAWLAQAHPEIAPGDLVADLGFVAQPRAEAAGGGPVISAAMMRQMLALGMELYLSEYPPLAPPEHA